MEDERPTLLMLGQGEPMRAALEEGLARYAAFAEVADADSPVAAVMAAAPDLVVLVGDAVRDRTDILTKLAGNAMTSSVPVVLLTPPDLEVSLSAARRGVRVVERTASADEMSKQIAALAREIPERPMQTSGALGEATLRDLLDIVKRQLESGILSVAQEGEDGRGARFVLEPGRNVDAAVRDFVRRIKPLLKEDKPLHYEFDEAGSGLAVLGDLMQAGDRAHLKDRRILLVEDDSAIADALAQELRAHGATTVVCTTGGSGLERSRDLDPEIVLVDEAALDGESYSVLRRIRRDLSLRWASLLVLRIGDVLPVGEAPRMDHLAASVVSLLAADREVSKRAEKGERFETRMEALGPSRLLRAVAGSGKTYQVTVRHPRVMVEISIAEGLIAGVEAVPMGGAARRVAGTTALAALLALSSGRVTIEPREAPAIANLLMEVGDAMAQAATETSPIRPSLPPPGASIPPGATGSARALLTELKGLLKRMKEVDGLADDISDEVDTAETLLPLIDPPDDDEPPTKKRQKLAAKQTMLGMPVVRSAVPTPASPVKNPVVPRMPPPPKFELPRPPTHAGRAAPSPKGSVAPPPPKAPVPPAPIGSVMDEEQALARATVSAVPPPPPAPPVLDGILGPVAGVPLPESEPPPPTDSFTLPGVPDMDETLGTPRISGLHRPKTPVWVWGAAGGALLLVLGLGTYFAMSGSDPVAQALPPDVLQAPPDLVEPIEDPVAPVAAIVEEPIVEPIEEPVEEPVVEEPVEPVVEPVVEPPVEEPEVDEPLDENETPRNRRQRLADLVRAGNFQRGQARWEAARRNYRRALALAPANGRALAGMTKVAMAQRRGSEAVTYARRLVRSRPRNAGNRVLLGDALRVSGNQAAARRAYEAALSINPRHRRARQRLGR